MKKIPIYQPSLRGNEKKYVLDCLDSTWISSKGKYIGEFEKKFAEYIGVSYAASVTNGTIALHLTLLALGIGKGDEVIVPTLTYIASVNAIRYTGATPVFIDCEREYWQIDVNEIERLITSKTKAIMPVHLYGAVCDMGSIIEIAKKYNLFVVEDCAEAIGSKFTNKKVGGFGDISAFSFFGNKTITTGEGGMVLTNDETLYERCLHLKGQGLAKYRQYWHDILGYNYRMTNICAAIGLAQLENIEGIIFEKRRIATWYKKYLLSNENVEIHNEQDGTFHTYWMISILVNCPEDRDPLRDFLENAGIETRPLFYPVHIMPIYSEKYQRFKNAEYLGWRGINLPSYPDLTEEQIEYICKSINSYFMGRE